MFSPKKSSLESRLASSTPHGPPVELGSDFSDVSSIHEEPNTEISDDEFSYSENYGQYFDDNKKKIRHAGKEWEEIKPKTSDRIYSSVIEDPKQTENIVLEILDQFERAPKSATIHVLQFFVDVCGFQDIDVKSLYDFKNANPAPIFMQMEKSKFLISKHKIFDRQTKLCEHVRNAVFNFVQKFVRLAWIDKFIFNDAFGVHILHFLQSAAMRNMRVVHATGLILGAKFLSEITFLYNKINDFPEILLAHRQKMFNYIEHLYLVIRKNHYRSQNIIYTPRVLIAREIYWWIKRCPDIFTSKFCCARILCILLRDRSFEVRKSALETCEKLLILEDLPARYLNYILRYVVYDIHERLLDVNDQVAIRSLPILSLIKARYPTFVKEEYFKIILSYIFNPSLVLAKQAASFIINMLRDENDSVSNVLLKLSNCVDFPEFSKLLPLLVESSFDHSYIIQTWDVYIELLKDSALDIATKAKISEMAYCAIYHTLTGKSLITRDPSVAVNVVEEDCHNITGQAFIPQMKILLSTFEASPKIMINLMNIIKLIQPTDNYSNHYEVIFTTLKKLFMSSNREEVLINIVETFYKIHSNQHFKARCDLLIREFVDDFFRNQLEFYKISIIFSKFDLTSYLDWEDITQNWEVINESTKYVLASSKCYLKWKLKILNINVIDNTLDEKNCRIMKEDISSMCKQFLKRCKELLNEADRLRNYNLALVVIHEIFDLCSFYKIELSTLSIMHNFLNSLEIRLDNEFQSKMINLACRLIFINTNITILERRKTFAEIMDLIFFDTCRSTYLATLFKYYHSHIELFGKLIENGLVKVNNAFENPNRVILYTLCMEYKELIQSKAVWELQGLRSLAMSFLSFKQLKYDIHFCQRGVNFATSSEENIGFLRILIYFINALKSEERKIILEEIRILAASKRWRNNNTRLFLSNMLKEPVIKQKRGRKGTNGVNKKKKITHVRSSEESTDSSIHYIDADDESP